MTQSENLLVTAMEECAEIQQDISKILRFGINGAVPGSNMTNENQLITEYYQLIAVMEMLFHEGVLHAPTISGAQQIIREKTVKVKKYRDVSRSLGLLNAES